MYTFISWGGGVQSTTLAVMSVLGDLPHVDAIIMADTGWERAKTNEAVKYYSQWLIDRGGRVQIVRADLDIKQSGIHDHKHIPLWSVSGAPLKRQCTVEFKLIPLKRAMRVNMGFHMSLPPHPKPQSCEVMLGISWDEMERMNPSRIKYMVNRWPLLEKRMTRTDCKEYLTTHNLPIPVKSSCVCCPYRNASTWMEIKNEKNNDFIDAIQFDENIRDLKLGGVKSNKLFLYKTAKPLIDVDLNKEANKERLSKQLPLFCSGLCGV